MDKQSIWEKPLNRQKQALKFETPFWIVSDTHFFHKNIVEYEPSRKQLEPDHNQFMLKAWQDTVQEHDTIIHLGDIAMGKPEQLIEIAPNLPGRKLLLMGNHDRRSKKFYRQLGFEVIPEFTIKYGKWNILFSHYPDDQKEFIKYPNHLNIHGHVHSQTRTEQKLINVSAEVQNFTPQPVTKIITDRIQLLENN